MSEMVGASISIKVPLSWEGDVEIHRHLSGWSEPNHGYRRPIYEGEQYITRTVRAFPCLEWFENGWTVDQPEGWEALEVSWTGNVNFGWEGDDDANNLLEWLREHGVPFIAQSDGVPGDFEATTEYFNGSTSIDAISTGMGAAMHANVWQSIVDAASKTHPTTDVNRWIVQAVDSWFAARSGDMGGWDISHLPDNPPLDDEEEADAVNA